MRSEPASCRQLVGRFAVLTLGPAQGADQLPTWC